MPVQCTVWDMTNFVIFRPRPPRRLCWSCSARAASTIHSTRSRYCLVFLC